MLPLPYEQSYLINETLQPLPNMFVRPISQRASGFIFSKAGPSHSPIQLAIRSRLASTSSRPTNPARPVVRARPAAPSTAKPAARSAIPPVAPTAHQAPQSWAWRPATESPPGFTDLERTIYARPFEGPLGNRVRMLWFLVPFWGLVVGFYLTTPVPPPRKIEGEEVVE